MKNKDIPKVQLRGGFSDRNKIKPENTEIQYTSLDDRTRIAIINLIDSIFSYVREEIDYKRIQLFLIQILKNVYCMEITARHEYDEDKVMNIIKQTVREDDYDCVFTVIEYFVSEIYELTSSNINAEPLFNRLFKKEYVGYRFVNNIITPITDENEIDAIDSVNSIPHESVKKHINKALVFLSDRDNPDYENSIKESISAVEAICEILTGVKGKEATLGNMLKKIENNGVVIHGALKSAFNILYGYTSDANGIRHAGDIGGPSSTFDEAKFMLVSCSAFINYLIGVSAS